jgi:hypothetical protein
LKIPLLDSFSPHLTRLRAKKAELNIETSKRKAACAIIRERMQKQIPHPGNDNEVRVRKILGETPVAATLPDQEQLWQLLTELEDLGGAAGVVDSAIVTETRIASNLLLAAVKPEVLQLGNKFAKAFLTLRAEHLEYNKFVDAIEDAGGNISTLRIRPNGLSDPSDLSGNYPHGLRDFADAGYISRSLAPEAI